MYKTQDNYRSVWKRLNIELHYEFRGDTDGYHIMLNGEQVHFTKDQYECDMFIAELKIKILASGLMPKQLEQSAKKVKKGQK